MIKDVVGLKGLYMPQLRIKIKHRFITKLLISHILLASIPLIITGAVLIHTVQKAVEKTVKERNMELARNLARVTEARIENAEKILEFNASNLINILKIRLAQDLFINEIVSNFSIFNAVKILDDSGRIVISTIAIEDSERYRSESFIQQVQQGEDYQSDVYLTDDQLPVIDLAEPIRFYNEIDGILLAEVNLKEMWDLVDNSVVGNYGQAFVFDRNGRYIAHSDFKKVYLKEIFLEEEILSDVKNNLNNQRVYINRDRIKMIAAYVSLSRMSWGVVIQQPLEEAFAVADKMRMQIFWFVAISIVLSSVIAYIYTRWIVTPVNQLVSGIDKFSEGDLHYRISPIGNDEISGLAERFNEMAEKLTMVQEKLKRSERLETLSKMASVLSHEIRNPLNAMVVNMQVMEREFNRSHPRISKLHHYLGIVASEIQRVDDLVNNFLMVARPPKLDRKHVNINQLIDDVIVSQQAEALQSGIRVNRKYHATDIDLLIDEKKIRQVFLNIFINAVQAMPGGGNVIIESELLNATEDDDQLDWAVIRFCDTGKGISNEQLLQIFDFYYSTKLNGTGLGLSVAQQIVEEHGGRIEVVSRVGKGSTFSVFLPKVKKK